MDRNLTKQFEDAKRSPIHIDVTAEVMERIEAPGKDRLFIPAAAALVVLAVTAALLFLPSAKLADSPLPQTEQKQVVLDHPYTYSPFTDPLHNIDLLKLMKGGV